MAKEQLAPLILCMESATGEDVAIQIEPNDDFRSFLDKAKLILGFDVDINSITKNQPVKLNENIYDFFINAEQEMQNDIGTNDEDTTNEVAETAPEEREDYIYILDDGTQIKASQADNAASNSNPIADAGEHHPELMETLQLKENLRETTVTSSDESSAKSSPSTKSLSYIPNIPFKLVRDENHEFDAEYSKYVDENEQGTRNGSQGAPKPLEYIVNGDEALTRDEVLEMFKDSPIVEAAASGARTSPSADASNDKPRRVRKTNPANRFPQLARDSQKHSADEANRCGLCRGLFSNESEVNRATNVGTNQSQAVNSMVMCEECLNFNFSLFKDILGDVELSSDDYLVEKFDCKMIYKKRHNVTSLRPHTDADKEQNDYNDTIEDAKAIIDKIESELRKQSNGAAADDNLGFIKLELDINGELLAKSIDDKGNYLLRFTKDNIKEEPFWVGKAESDFGEIECLESTEDQVMNFMDSHGGKDFVCRLCSETFPRFEEAISHSLQHRLIEEDVFPCILCEYGYKTGPELKYHMLTEHGRMTAPRAAQLVLGSETSSPGSVPVAARTRSSSFKKERGEPRRKVDRHSFKNDSQLDPVTGQKVEPLESKVKVEVKEEAAEVSADDDEGIWIVQTTSEPDALEEDVLVQLLRNAMDVKENFDNSELLDVLEGRVEDKKVQLTDHKCSACNQCFTSASFLLTHSCSKRGRGVKPAGEGVRRKVGRPKGRPAAGRGADVKREDEEVIEIEDEDEIGSAVKPKRIKLNPDDDFQMEEEWIADDDDEDYIYEDRVRARPKRKKRETTSDPQVVSCRHCDQSFTSKVRLRFHLQFHEPPHSQRASPLYVCSECPASVRRNFDTEAALFDHVHFQHDKRKRWFCPEPGCGKTFYLRATLTRHCRMHTDTRRYRCDTCGKRFLDKQTLDEHSVSHLSIKPYQCHICLKHLTRRSRLRMHLRAHEDELAPRLVHVCGVCDRAFKDSGDAEKHAAESADCLKANADAEAEPELEAGTQQVSQELSADAQRLIRLVEIEKAFRCEFCEDVFYLEDALNEHRGQHRTVKNPFTCHICKVSFSTYSRCTTHKTTHGYYKKSIEDVKRRQEGGSEDVKGVTEDPSVSGIVGYGGFPVVKHFLCETCNRSYLHWTYLQVHRRMKHAGENYTFKCKTCDAEFPNSWGVAYHRRKVHGKSPRQLVGRSSEIEARRLDGAQGGPHTCRDCDTQHPTKSALHRHRRASHPTGARGGLFACATCGRRYAGRAGLEAHARAHDGERARAFACGKCGVVFECVGSLAAHVKMVHSGDMEHLCPLCAKAFCSRTELAVHQRTHSADKPHICPVCGHAFRTVSMRNEHLRIHTDERPFPCDICGVAFRRSTAMRNHRLIHTGERNYACARCPKRFRIRSDLRTHIRIKHPGQILVLEVGGLNPEPAEILEQLAMNNITPSKIVDIKKISVPAGTVRDSSVFLDENSINVLSRMAARDADNESWTSNVLRAIGSYGRLKEEAPEGTEENEIDMEPQKIRRGRGIAKNPRKFRLYEGRDEPEEEEDRENAADRPAVGLGEYRIVVDQDLASMHVLDGAVMVADENGGAQLIHIDEHGRLVDENGALLSLDGAVLRLEDGAMLEAGATLVTDGLQLVEDPERAAGVLVQQVEN